VTATTPAGLTLSKNPSDPDWQGTPIVVTGATGLPGSTINISTLTTLASGDVVRMQYDANVGDLQDLDGNEVTSGEIWIGGSAASYIELQDYSSNVPITLRGNAGNDVLTGTDNGDLLVDGGGGDRLTGGPGADLIRLVENGSSTAYSRDTVTIAIGDSVARYGGVDVNDLAMDVITGSSTSPAGTGFYILSGSTSDILDLPSNVIAANATHADGTDAGGFAKHSITSGIITFENASDSPLSINTANALGAVAYLQANFTTPGETVAFKIDIDGNGVADSLVVFQDAGFSTLLGAEVPDVTVLLQDLNGIGSAILGDSAGVNVVYLQDQQAPIPISYAFSDAGVLTLDFTENAFAPVIETALALPMYKNGVTPMSISSIDDGSMSLAIHTNQTLVATDWVMLNYLGGEASDGISDAAGNVWDEGAPTSFAMAAGRDGNTTIDISALNLAGTPFQDATNFDLYGRGGNDNLTGGDYEDWLEGGADADYLTGGSSQDEFGFTQGDSPAVDGLALGGDGVLNDGDTFSFANGADVVTDLTNLDGQEGVELATPLFSFASQPSYMGDMPSNGQATDQGYFVVQGNYVDSGTAGSAGTFTVDSASGADTLIVWDGDHTGGVTQTAIVLQSVTVGELFLNTGWIQHQP
jgi:hypothetical protein